MNIRDITEHHQYPAWLMRHPQWIFLHYALLRLFFLRSRIIRRALDRYIGNSDGTPHRILDVGCGEGQYIVPLAMRYPDLDLTGIDLLTGHITFLDRLKEKAGLSNCTFIHEEIVSHLSDTPRYSLVYLIGVLQYTDDPERMIHMMYRCQNPGDRLMIYTPVSGGIEFGFYRYIRQRYGHYDDAQAQYRPIEASKIREWINNSGYRVIRDTSHYGYAASLGHQMMQSILILMTYWWGILKLIPAMFFILLSPAIILLQMVEHWQSLSSGSRHNSLLLVLEK